MGTDIGIIPCFWGDIRMRDHNDNNGDDSDENEGDDLDENTFPDAGVFDGTSTSVVAPAAAVVT